MAANEIPVHVHVTAWSGLYRCDTCERLWSWKLAAAEILRDESLICFRSRCCGTSTEVLEESVIAVITVEVADTGNEG